jgi:hypothetical protein
MRQTHAAGEKLFVDFAGDTVPVFDGLTGEVRAAKIFVAVLGASRGPPIAGMWGNRHTFWPSQVLAWASERNLGPPKVSPTPVVSAPPIAAQSVPVEEMPPEPRAWPTAQAARVVDDDDLVPPF